MRFSRVAGLWYAQNATEGAGVQWVVAEVARRTERVLALPLARMNVPPHDQVVDGTSLICIAACCASPS